MKFKTTLSTSPIDVSKDERIKEFIEGAKTSSISSDSFKSSEKVKVVRDGFSMPIEDYKLIDQARRKALILGLSDIDGVSKSQILRIALRFLEKIGDEEFIKIFNETKKR